jgi:hypothetical protein
VHTLTNGRTKFYHKSQRGRQNLTTPNRLNEKNAVAGTVLLPEFDQLGDQAGVFINTVGLTLPFQLEDRPNTA